MILKKYTEFINENNIETGEFSSAEEYLTKKEFVLENGLWNHPGGIFIENKHRHLLIKNGKLIVKFGVIKGLFNITGSLLDSESDLKLKSADGLPVKCMKLDISYNKIESLKGIGTFEELDASFNRLTDLQGCPEIIDGKFDVHGNNITTLKGGPKEVIYYFDVSNNKLTDLQGFPVLNNSTAYLFDNDLETFYGIKIINRSSTLSNKVAPKVPEEEIEFLKSKSKTAGKKITNYALELVEYILKEYDESVILKLNLPDVALVNLPEKYKNLFRSSKGIKKFNI